MLQIFHANLASADMRSNQASFQCICRRGALECLVNSCKPEAVFVSKIMASSTTTIAFNKWSCSEVF